MRWFKHLVDSGDDPDIGAAIEQFGWLGYYIFFRTLEVMSREFNVENPGKNTFNFAFFCKKFGKIHKKTLLKILLFYHKKGRIKFKMRGNNISLYCPKLKDLADDYTKKMLALKSGQTPDKIRSKSRKNPSQDIDIDLDIDKKKKENNKKKKNPQPKKGNKKMTKKEIEESFEKLRLSFPVHRRGKRTYCFNKFKALVKQGKHEEFRQTTIGYFEFLKHQRLNRNFDQEAMGLATWLNNWEGDRDLYLGFEYQPKL